MKKFSSLMAEQTLLPIIQAKTPEEGVLLAKAMQDSGLHLVEVVLRTEASLEALIAIKKELPDLIVGAGTVIDTQILQKALEAGSDFIVTPAVSAHLLSELAKLDIPVLPGVSTTGEILQAYEYGFMEQKLFPASLAGGAPFLSALSSVFQDVSFCPTGGINGANKEDFLSLPNVFAAGGTWMVPKDLLAAQDWVGITEACRLAQQ